LKGRLLNGLDATARIVKESPTTRVILLSMHANGEYLRQALQVGASGYLLNGAELAELELALKTVARGEKYLTPAVVKYASKPTARNLKGWLVHCPS
jgi:DNA-binding NarL/FixJ family response regulator